MSLGADLSHHHYAPVLLVEIDVYDFATFATNVASFTWYISFENLYAWIDAAFLDTGWEMPDVALVGSVKTDEGFYTATANSDACIATGGTFYFDVATKGLWVHRLDGNNPLNYPFLYGVVFGFRRGGTKSYLDDVEYEDRVLSVPNITRSKPGYYVGKITNEGGTVELDNADGYFDRFFKNVTALGNVIRTKLGLAHYNLEKYVKIFTGNILKAKTGTRKMLVDVKELTGALDATINPNRYNISEFAFLNTSNAGKTKPTGYGKLNDFPVVCVNETQSPAPANYIFHVLDTTWHPMHDLTAAYTYDGDVRTARTPLNIDLAAGTFELAAADYTPGQEVTVDCEAADDGAGNPIENALDVMSSLIVDHTPAQYTASYFRSWDTTNAADIGIAFTAETSVEKAIEEITQKGTLAYFCVENDGRYSALMFDATEPSDVTLQECDIKRMAEVEDTKDELVGTLVVKYDRQIKRGTYKTVTDNTYQSDVNWLYETASQKEIETVISNTADAADFAARFQAEYGVPGKYVEVTTALFPYALRITKIITLPVTRVKNIAIGTYRGEVRGITVNYNDNEVTFRLRLFEEVVT